MVRLVTQAVLNVGAGMHSVAYVNLMKNGHDKTPQAHVLCHDRPSLPYLRVFQQPPIIVEATAPDWGRVDRRIRRCPKTRRMYDCKCRVTGAHNRNAPNRLLCTMAEKGDRTIGGIRGIESPFGRRDGRRPYNRRHPGHQGFTTRARFDTAFEDSHKLARRRSTSPTAGRLYPSTCCFNAAAYSSM